MDFLVFKVFFLGFLGAPYGFGSKKAQIYGIIVRFCLLTWYYCSKTPQVYHPSHLGSKIGDKHNLKRYLRFLGQKTLFLRKSWDLVEYSTVVEYSTGPENFFPSVSCVEEHFNFLNRVDISKSFWYFLQKNYPPPKKKETFLGGG